MFMMYDEVSTAASDTAEVLKDRCLMVASYTRGTLKKTIPWVPKRLQKALRINDMVTAADTADTMLAKEKCCAGLLMPMVSLEGAWTTATWSLDALDINTNKHATEFREMLPPRMITSCRASLSDAPATEQEPQSGASPASVEGGTPPAVVNTKQGEVFVSVTTTASAAGTLDSRPLTGASSEVSGALKLGDGTEVECTVKEDSFSYVTTRMHVWHLWYPTDTPAGEAAALPLRIRHKLHNTSGDNKVIDFVAESATPVPWGCMRPCLKYTVKGYRKFGEALTAYLCPDVPGWIVQIGECKDIQINCVSNEGGLWRFRFGWGLGASSAPSTPRPEPTPTPAPAPDEPAPATNGEEEPRPTTPIDAPASADPVCKDVAEPATPDDTATATATAVDQGSVLCLTSIELVAAQEAK